MAEIDKLGPTCQSCSMPLEGEKDYGTNVDSSVNHKYCRFCYKDGRFTEPGMTVERMIDRIVGFMMLQKVMEEHEVKKIANTIIPQLERWRKKPAK